MARPDSVYFFGTCLVDLFYPQAGLAAIRLIQREGVRVIFPQGQTCCGQPAFNSGYQDDARAVARKQIALFPGDLPIVVPSGSCAAMMRHHYPALFEGEADHAAAAAFASRICELTQFLTTLGIELRDRGEPVKVAWHASCHAMREMGVGDEPKSLVRQLSNVELLELSRERECCGFGGTFSVRYPEISAAMVSDKAADVVATGAQELLSADCGCLMNIAGALGAKGVPLRARHVAEFLWERTRER
ncbi:MAG TPA: (Fe-S)-binding protein [Thermoanaerobaculia bacterium]